MLAGALKSRKTHILLAVAGCYLAWELWLTIAAPFKVVDSVDRPEKLNTLFTLPFPTEPFHVQRFHAYGRVSGTQDNAIKVRGVKRADLTTVARPYWVTRVEPLQPGG